MNLFKSELQKELSEINEMFQMGFISAKERFSLDFKAKQADKMINRIATN